jgi:Fe-S-cluster containining protein
MSHEDLSRHIFEECERLTEEDEFSFSCHPGVPCFNACCADINIVLTPYDVLRLKNRLGITSGEFLAQHTLMPVDKEIDLPTPVLKMRDDVEGKPCPFVGEGGCGVYEDRPWACRMYPLGLAAPGSEDASGEPFYFLLREDKCKGHDEVATLTVGQWLDEQGIRPYDEQGESFKRVQFHEFFRREDAALDPRQMQMYFLACYDLDSFRRFVFGSTFLERFEVDEATQASIRDDDVALLEFGLRWIRASVFGEAGLMTLRNANPSDQT